MLCGQFFTQQILQFDSDSPAAPRPLQQQAPRGPQEGAAAAQEHLQKWKCSFNPIEDLFGLAQTPFKRLTEEFVTFPKYKFNIFSILALSIIA